MASRGRLRFLRLRELLEGLTIGLVYDEDWTQILASSS